MKLEEIDQEILKILIKALTIKGLLEDYVILKETENGRRYVEYAFKEGAPEENSCLSWYIQPHPKTKERYEKEHEGLVEMWKHADSMVGHICVLSPFTCSGEHGCKVGHPPVECSYNNTCHKDWSKEEPIKCACWDLRLVKSIDDFKFCFNIDELNRFLKDE